MSDLTEAEKTVGRVRETALHHAMQTATIGEDPMAVLARAQLYEEWVWPRAASGIDTRQSQDGETRLGPKDESPTAEKRGRPNPIGDIPQDV